MKNIITNRKLTLTIVLGIISLCALVAYGAVVSVSVGTGTIPSSELFNGPADLAVRQITMQPGDVIPWHYHPGRAYVVVKSGTVTETDGCGATEIFTAGQAFEEPVPKVHQLANTGAVQAELIATIIVPAGQPRTINPSGPLCGPPRNVDQCKDNGWMNFNFPTTFENQGACVSAVATGR